MKNNNETKIRNRVILVILDGFGINPSKANNAILQANTPKLDEYFSKYPHTVLEASGEAVGLPSGQMGNSEVGHMTIGCGTIIRQDLIRINDAIADGSFFEMSPLLRAIKKAKKKQGYVHLIGLLSDGGVHSHIDHVVALVHLCRDHDVRPFLHAITDGRDTPPQSAGRYIDYLRTALQEANGFVATVTGRYYAMDRDRRWERTMKAWQAMALSQGERADSADDAVKNAYARGETDEFISPTAIKGAQPDGNDEIQQRVSRAGDLSATQARNESSGNHQWPQSAPVPLCGDGKVPARYILHQWRAGRCLRRRRSKDGAVSEGCHV